MIGSVTDWVILIIVIVILFGGASKVPELARAMGRAVGEYKKAQMEVEKEIRAMEKEVVASAPAPAPAQAIQSVRPVASGAYAPPAAAQAQPQQDLNSRIEQLERELAELKRRAASAG